MKYPIIKICGITREEDLLLCEELGVEMVGFNFVPSSPRCISLERARELRSQAQQCAFIGVFQDASIDDMQNIADAVRLDGVQMHGEAECSGSSCHSAPAEGQTSVASAAHGSGMSPPFYTAGGAIDDAEFLPEEPPGLLRIIKAFRSVPDASVLREWTDAGATILLDGTANGARADWDAIARLPEGIRSRVILAGGLTPENVAEAIRMVRPYGVDVASGVESSPGVKDGEKMREFVEKVRSVMIPTPTP